MINSVTIMATFYVSVAVVAAFFAQPFTSRMTETTRIYAAWLLSTPFILIGTYSLIAVVCLIAVLAALSPGPLGHRAAFFIGVLPMAPDFARADIPFIGVNNFLTISHPAACAIAIFAVPVIARLMTSKRFYLTATDVFVVVFTVYITVTSIRELPITSVMRVGTVNFLSIMLPYFAISRGVKTVDDAQRVLYALITMVTIVSIVSLVAQLKYWDFYTIIPRAGGTVMIVRYGILRADSLFQGGLIGWASMVAALGLIYFWRRDGISWPRMLLLLSLFLMTIVFTVSRAAYLVAGAGVGVAICALMTGRWARMAVLTCMVLGGAALWAYAQLRTLDALDEFGTFSYRSQLIEASLKQIADYPFFGTPNFLESEHMKPMVQGLGIIDVVNTYFQVVLAYGLVGLVLYVGMHLLPLHTLMRALGGYSGSKPIDPDLHSLIIIVVAGILPFLILLGLTSDVAYVANVGIFLIAFSQALARMVPAKAKASRVAGKRALPRPHPAAE